MKISRILCFLLLAVISGRLEAEDFFDQVDQALTLNAFDGNLRARFSGLFDLELYALDQPPPGLIDTEHHLLVNPRLSMFLDAQLGSHVYLFAQARADRGFDPADNDIGVRMDEYGIRINPWEPNRFVFQIGKFATAVGNYVQRHLSWDNPFVTAPLPYESLTPVWDTQAPGRNFFAGVPVREDTNLPIIWGPSYASGASVAAKLGKFKCVFEIKNSALASRPKSWDTTETGFDNPTFSGRLSFDPDQAWSFGVSASDGPYLRPYAIRLPSNKDFNDYHEIVLGQDIRYALHHLQLWAEFYEVRFQVPRVGDADTFAYYLEGKYKVTPELFFAVRWNQQLFSTITDADGSRPWSNEIWRVDASVGYRFTPNMQMKLQYSFQNATPGVHDLNQLLAAQFTVRF
jgi:hypothetical protein